MTGVTSSRDQSGSYFYRTGPYPVRGGPVPVGGGSRGRREAVGDLCLVKQTRVGKGLKLYLTILVCNLMAYGMLLLKLELC